MTENFPAENAEINTEIADFSSQKAKKSLLKGRKGPTFKNNKDAKD